MQTKFVLFSRYFGEGCGLNSLSLSGLEILAPNHPKALLFRLLHSDSFLAYLLYCFVAVAVVFVGLKLRTIQNVITPIDMYVEKAWTGRTCLFKPYIGHNFHRLTLIPQGIMGSIEDSLNRIVEAITPRGLGGNGPRKVKVSELCKLVKSLCSCC